MIVYAITLVYPDSGQVIYDSFYLYKQNAENHLALQQESGRMSKDWYIEEIITEDE